VILRGLKAVLSWILALLILFEEWGWEPLGRLLARIGRLPLIAFVERRIQSLPPYGALAVFFVPTLALVPVKLVAVWLIAHGEHLAGVTMIIVAKLAGTAVMARLFALTQPALMRLDWFARLYRRWIAWKDGLLGRVRASAAWRAIERAKAAARTALARLRALLGSLLR
jgi:hypothetical protein